MIKHVGVANGIKELEEELNSVEECSTIYFDNSFTFHLTEGKRFLVGARAILSIISIRKRDLTIDGQGNRITVYCSHAWANDISFIHICQEALGVNIRNLIINFVYEGENTSKKVIAVRNNAYGVKINGCKICMESKTQISFTVIQNDRNVETVFDREGDNFVVEDCDIRIRCNPTTHELKTYCCGIYNDLPNSMSVEGNYIYIMANGIGMEQRSVGIYNNGRFVRIVNNNIKANGYHMEGTGDKHTYVIGVHNEGEYLLFSANNCIAEWAGKAIGLLNVGQYCSFTGNKFIGTHAIYGISVHNEGVLCTYVGNLVTSTSRNPRLIINRADNVSINSNILKGFFYLPDCQSGCGMLFEKSKHCNAVGNQIFGVKNCGIYLRASEVAVMNNEIESQKSNWAFVEVADENDLEISSAIDENKIHSIEEIEI